jgi:hypothetical protein
MKIAAEKLTHNCTPVVIINDERNISLDLVARHTDEAFIHKQKPFSPDLKMKTEEVKAILECLIKSEGREQNQKRIQNSLPCQIVDERNLAPIPKAKKAEKISWEQQVNNKRSKILEIIQNSKLSTISAIAKAACCHASTVKSVFDQLQLLKGIQTYRYQPGHDQKTHNALRECIEDPANIYAAASDIKRTVPQCSKKFIRAALRATGRRYLKSRRERKVPNKREYSAQQMKQVLWTSVQAFARNDETLWFLDEVEFPLNLSSDYCWSKPEQTPVYNRRPMQQSLYVIAVCSQERFIAIQVYSHSINQEALHHFLVQVLGRTKENKRIAILLDNAGWHKARSITTSSMGNLLLFNVSYMFELNLIENCFSAAKAEWRRRPVAVSYEAEVKEVVRIFTEAKENRFAGYRRQYLRNLIKFTNNLEFH